MDKEKEIERIKRFQDIITNRIEKDIFTPRRLVTLQGKEIDELTDMLANYYALIKLPLMDEQDKYGENLNKAVQSIWGED